MNTTCLMHNNCENPGLIKCNECVWKDGHNTEVCLEHTVVCEKYLEVCTKRDTKCENKQKKCEKFENVCHEHETYCAAFGDKRCAQWTEGRGQYFSEKKNKDKK